jgi:hypothetical protein
VSRDPLAAAGRSWCEACQEWGLPQDAIFLGEGLILATYAGCDHVATTRLVDTTELRPDVRCTATTKAGRRCHLDAGPGGLCPTHAGSRREASR